MVHLDDTEKKQVEDLLTTIKDSELREEMGQFLQKQMRLLKSNAKNQRL
jgi:hypothetical protein